MINFTWSLGLNTQLKAGNATPCSTSLSKVDAQDRQTVEWEVAGASHNPLARLFQDYDWADEVLHAKIGRDWYVSEFKSPARSGPVWRRMLVKGPNRLAQLAGARFDAASQLVAGRVREACARWNITPDPQVLAFHETYETQRADLKAIAGSA